MAFRALNFGSKMIVLGIGGAAAGSVLALWTIPYYKDVYKVLTHYNEIPRFKREYIVEAWQKLQEQTDNNTLLKKYLDSRVLDQLKSRKTDQDGTLMHIMQEGLNDPKSVVGAVAPDPASYGVFSKLFDPILAEINNGAYRQPSLDWGQNKLDYFESFDKDQKYVENTRLELYRSLKFFLFHPLLRETDYFLLENAAEKSLYKMVHAEDVDPELKGTYANVKKLPSNVQSDLDKSNLMLKNDNERLKALGVYKNWPTGRGVFYNENKNLVIWVGEEEHLKFISTEKGDNVKAAMERLIKAAKAVDSVTPFARCSRVGSVAFSPVNVGSGLSVILDVKLPKLSRDKDFKETCEKLNLSCQDKGNGVFSVSNKCKLGLSEYDTAKLVYDGVKKLIELDQGGGGSSSSDEKPKKG